MTNLRAIKTSSYRALSCRLHIVAGRSISAERTGMVDKINKNKSSSDLSERRKTDLQGSGAASGDFWTENLLKWIRRNLPK